MTRAPLDHIVLMASDIDASVDWYDAFTPLLGFEKTRDHVYQHPDGWAIDLRAAKADAAPYGRHNAGLNHIGLRVESEKAVLAVRAGLAEKGYDVPAPQIFDGEETVVFFADPDGMRWEVGHHVGGAL